MLQLEQHGLFPTPISHWDPPLHCSFPFKEPLVPPGSAVSMESIALPCSTTRFLRSFPMQVPRDIGIFASGDRRKTSCFLFLESLLIFLQLPLGLASSPRPVQAAAPQEAEHPCPSCLCTGLGILPCIFLLLTLFSSEHHSSNYPEVEGLFESKCGVLSAPSFPSAVSPYTRVKLCLDFPLCRY